MTPGLVRAQDAAATPPPPVDTTAITGGPDFKHFSIEAQFDYGPNLSLRMADFQIPSGNSTSISGAFTGMRILPSLRYRPTPGIEVAAFVGVTLGGRLTNSGTIANPTVHTVDQTFNFDNAVTYGVAVNTDLLRGSRFHIMPQMGWMNTDFGGTSGSVSNDSGACTYDYSSNNVSTCYTLGGNVAQGVLRSAFTKMDFIARLGVAIDIGAIESPWMRIEAGAGAGYSLVFGRATISAPLGASTAREDYNFGSSIWQTPYGRLSFMIGSLKFGAEGSFYSQLTVSGFLGMSF